MIEVGSTGLTTSGLAFGCAGAFRLPRRVDRSRLLDAAVDAGFTHFDVAPMYGMGLAEPELARLLRRHGDRLSVTTKFGIRPSPIGLLAGKVQGPIRRVLAARPQVNTGLQKAASGPSSGIAGRLLYTQSGFTPDAARQGLHQSLAALGRGTIDLFILHDPLPEQMDEAEKAGTVEVLEAEVDAGTIRSWGVAVHEPDADGPAAALLRRAPFLQVRDDLFLPLDRGIPADKGTATYGALAGSLPLLESHLSSSSEVRRRWTDELDLTEEGPTSLASLVLRETARRNPGGPVLFTTTKAHRLAGAMEAITFEPPDEESSALRRLVDEARHGADRS